METTFKILERKKWSSGQNLIIELGWEGISFVWYEKVPLRVNSIIQYQFKRNRTAEQLADLLDNLFNKENDYFENIEEADIFFNFSETELVPEKYYNAAVATELLGYKHGKEAEAILFTEKVKIIDGINVYRVHEDILDTLKTYFPAIKVHHSNSANVELALERDGNALFCIVYNNSFKALLNKNGRLQIVQYFQYNAPNDVAYHLLNICSQHGIEACRLYLSGLIDESSMLYNTVSKFFGDVVLLPPNEQIAYSEPLLDQPLHFFAHLTSLTRCASSAEILAAEK